MIRLCLGKMQKNNDDEQGKASASPAFLVSEVVRVWQEKMMRIEHEGKS